MLFGGGDSLPSFLARHYIPGLDVVVDPCAAILVFVVTGLLCVGIKEVQLGPDSFYIRFHFRQISICCMFLHLLNLSLSN